MRANGGNIARLDGQEITFWDQGLVRARLQEMGSTLKRLPGSNAWWAELPTSLEEWIKPKDERFLLQFGSMMPDVVRDPWELFTLRREREDADGKRVETEILRTPAKAAAVDRMERCLTWFAYIRDTNERRHTWAWALGMGAHRQAKELRRIGIGDAPGPSRATIERRITAGLGAIVAGLNATVEVAR